VCFEMSFTSFFSCFDKKIDANVEPMKPHEPNMRHLFLYKNKRLYEFAINDPSVMRIRRFDGRRQRRCSRIGFLTTVCHPQRGGSRHSVLSTLGIHRALEVRCLHCLVRIQPAGRSVSVVVR
jgi:hypothetical protein